ncbi:hypothetical protein HII36_03830 [Nonomuraea sp. NN258]|uniref:hypothetical protein n=1 Tax=Nonomuraea antri TaxID=2730852 RepID=UPI00156951AB|nr:hypothetical protein [Nonomuraea antri]NRQ30963.1 hypothetical protein [Nonomuraea antri]
MIWLRMVLCLGGIAGVFWLGGVLLTDGPFCTPDGCADPVPYRVELPLDPVTWGVTTAGGRREEPADRPWAVRDGVLQRWDGATWRTADLPQVPVPDTVGDPAKLTPGRLKDVVNLSETEAWAVGDLTTHLCCDLWSHHRELIMRWDGRSWRLLDLGLRGVRLHHAAPDGAGGLWVTAEDGRGKVVMLHQSGGRWTQSPVRLPAGTPSADVVALGRGRLTLMPYNLPTGLPEEIVLSPA